MADCSPLDRIADDKDVIGFPTLTYRITNPEPFVYNVYNLDEGGRMHAPKDMAGMQRVDAVGSGCVLVARRVFEKIDGPFMRLWNPDGTQAAGPDIAFSGRCRDAGFEIWADWDRRCEHYTNVGAEACVQVMQRAVNRGVEAAMEETVTVV